MVNKTVLLISPECWGINFVSKHHYADYLSKQNKVYFLNPVTNSIINPFGNVNVEVKLVKENLFQVNYQNIFPRLNIFPKFFQDFIYKKQAQQIQQALCVNEFDIVWSFDPRRFWNQNVWKSAKKIYHSVDVHQSKFENNISKSSDLTIIVSKYLKSKISTFKNLVNIGHGAHIIKESANFLLPGSNEIKIGFVGNFLSDNIDYSALELIVNTYKEKIDLICIGPYKEKSNLGGHSNELLQTRINSLRSYSNVYFIGSVTSDKIGNYISKVDINLILYIDYKKNIFPHKLMQYLAIGKCVISSYLADFESSILIPLVFSENEKELDLKRKVDLVIDNLNEFNSISNQNIRKQYGIENSYDNKIKKISKLLYKND